MKSRASSLFRFPRTLDAKLLKIGNVGYATEVVLAAGQAPFIVFQEEPTSTLFTHGPEPDFCQGILPYLG